MTQKRSSRYVKNGTLCILTGAGTGKTFVLNEYLNCLKNIL